MARKEGTFTFSFSQKNWDVKELTDKMKEDNPHFRITEYFCEAARFYEKYKNNAQLDDSDALKKLIDERVLQMLSVLDHRALSAEQTSELEDDIQSSMVAVNFDGKIDDIDDGCLGED